MAFAQSSAQESFDQLKSLAGDWQGPVTVEPPQPDVSTHKPAHISLRVTLFKGYGLIERFSEDIGQPATVEELEGLSAKKPRASMLSAGSLPGVHSRSPT